MGAVLIDFIFKRKQINVDCFIDSYRTAITYPIRRSFQYIPEWWRKLPQNYHVPHEITKKPYERPTMRSCYGITSLYKRGFIMPLWADIDLFFEQDEEKATYSYQSVAELKIIQHEPKEYGNNFSRYHHMKLQSPWLIREKSGVEFLFTPCLWSHLDSAPHLRVVPGVLNFKHQYSTNVNWFVPHMNATFRLESGMPLAQIIPLTDKNVKLSVHVLDVTEYEKIRTVTRLHKFRFGFQKVIKDSNKCPMRGLSDE